jgi:hypothetical protein
LKSLASLLLLCYCCSSSAQKYSAVNDSSQGVADTAVSYYHKFTNQRSRLFNGKEFIPYDPRIEGHAFFGDADLHRGSVVYDGLFFDNVNMQYDLVKDEVVIQHFDVFFKVMLIPEKVKEFHLNDHYYKRLTADSSHRIPVATGFYDYLHEGNISLIAKRSKRIEETITDKINMKITERNFYYIIKDEVFHPVKSLKSLMSVFGDQAKMVRQDLRKGGLKYRKNREASIIRAVKFYDSLKN